MYDSDSNQSEWENTLDNYGQEDPCRLETIEKELALEPKQENVIFESQEQ